MRDFTPVPGAKVIKEAVTVVTLFPPTDESDDRRLASVISFDYKFGKATRIIVDLTGDDVVDAQILPSSSAPVGLEEAARAKELLAEDSSQYRALFGAPRDSYDLATFVSTGNGDLAGHRILLIRPVYFRTKLRAPIALVDLTADRVLQYED